MLQSGFRQDIFLIHVLAKNGDACLNPENFAGVFAHFYWGCADFQKFLYQIVFEFILKTKNVPFISCQAFHNDVQPVSVQGQLSGIIGFFGQVLVFENLFQNQRTFWTLERQQSVI